MQNLRVQTGCGTLDFKRRSEGTPSRALRLYPAAWGIGSRHRPAPGAPAWGCSGAAPPGGGGRATVCGGPGLSSRTGDPGLTLPLSPVDLLRCC